MRFYKNIIRTFHDLPGHHSMLVHSLAGCNLKCIGCHNYDDLVANQPSDYSTEQEVIRHIQQNGNLFEAVILSGGEFLLEKLEAIENFLIDIRRVFKGIIIVNSNGSFPNKIAALLDKGLVDGIHLDCKLPYHLLDAGKDQEIYNAILGVSITEDFRQKLLASIELVIRHNSKYSQIRTVKYPLLSEEFFEVIKEYVEQLNQSFESSVSYEINDFVYLK